MSQGPLQIRNDTRQAFLGVAPPAEGELLITHDEANEGAIWVGAQGGGPLGGVQAGLRPQDRGKLAGAPAQPYQRDLAAKVIASARDWQTDPAAPGWKIPTSNQVLLHHPIVGGFVPARALADGGWVDIYATGWYRRAGSANGTLVARLEGNGAYIGPTWAGGYQQGWGWWTQDPADGGLENLVDWNWTFQLRMTSLGWKGTKDADDNTVFWRLEGYFEAWGGTYVHQKNEDHATTWTSFPGTVDVPGNTNNDGANDKNLFRRKRRLIREHKGVIDPCRDLELVLWMGNPRPDGQGTTLTGDTMHVHGADMVVHAPSRGRAFGPGHIGAPKGNT